MEEKKHNVSEFYKPPGPTKVFLNPITIQQTEEIGSMAEEGEENVGYQQRDQ